MDLAAFPELTSMSAWLSASPARVFAIHDAIAGALCAADAAAQSGSMPRGGADWRAVITTGVEVARAHWSEW